MMHRALDLARRAQSFLAPHYDYAFVDFGRGKRPRPFPRRGIRLPARGRRKLNKSFALYWSDGRIPSGPARPSCERRETQ